MTWRIDPIPLAPFRKLFALSDTSLLALGARRMTATESGAAPCRVSLMDAEIGETLLLVNHEHLEEPSSPYRARGPVFVREAARPASLSAREVPNMLARRLLSARAYDADWMMVDADVVEGARIAEQLDIWFADPAVRSVHLHTARRGCFMAAAGRIDG